MTQQEWIAAIGTTEDLLEQSFAASNNEARSAYALQSIAATLRTVSRQLQDIYGLMIEEMVEDGR